MRVIKIQFSKPAKKLKIIEPENIKEYTKMGNELKPIPEKPEIEKIVPCPKPFYVKIDAAKPYVFKDDFNAAMLAKHDPDLNHSGLNYMYLHTFLWKPDYFCCVATKAVLTVKMKANQNGTANGSNAGNDSIGIYTNGGTVVAPYNEKVYVPGPMPFNAGQTAVKTWTLNPAALTNLNNNWRLSFLVQDDTSVTSATLEIWGCCVPKNK